MEGILEHADDDVQARFLPGIVNGRDRWCQGFSEPDAGSDLASLRTRADRDGDDYVITGHKVWTSYSDDAEWCLVLARTDHEVAQAQGHLRLRPPHAASPASSSGRCTMINGITKEFGEVLFDGARVPAANMIGRPGEGWPLAMTIVSHEREPHELGFAGRYAKQVKDLVAEVQRAPRAATAPSRSATWPGLSSNRRCCGCTSVGGSPTVSTASSHGPEGSVDKLLMTWTEQAVGHAALSIGGVRATGSDDTLMKVYLYSRAQSVMGGTSQIQRNLVASRILHLPAS